jgi:ABC-type dipeptide/oligopeptide/nickel transport system permease subunit
MLLQSQETNSGSIWKKLRRNKAAMAGLWIISFAVLICMLGYLIAPDNTPAADLQTVEIQSKPPGYSQLFLKLPAANIVKTGNMEGLLFGKPSAYKYLPIKNYRIAGDEIVTAKYVDEDTAVSQSYKLAAITGGHPENINKYIVTKKYWLGTDAFGGIFSAALL